MKNSGSLKGIILAGGKSLRFGEDKALASVNGERLIEKPVKLLRSLGLETIVIANPTRDYSFLNCTVQNDLIPGKGPLGGLLTAFSMFPETSLLTLTCDMPNLTKSALKGLIQNHKLGNITLFKVPGSRFQPFPGIYSASLLEQAKVTIERNDVSMQSFLKSEAESICFVPLPCEAFLLANINTKSDLL